VATRNRFVAIAVVVVAFVLSVAIAVQGQPTTTAPVQWSGNGHWYQFVYQELNPPADSWDAARQWAQDHGGYLATPTSAEENAFLVSILDQVHSSAWLGGYKSTGVWVWDTGEPWAYTNWIPGQPSGDGNYLSLTESAGWGWGKWNDAASTIYPSFAALVEYDCYMPTSWFDRGADVNCDGVGGDVFDVIAAIEIAFSGGTVIPCAWKP
jgi:hypothetical protein